MKKDKKLAKKIKDTKQEVAECHTSDNEGNDFVFHFCNPTIDELSTLRGVFWQTMDENSENLSEYQLRLAARTDVTIALVHFCTDIPIDGLSYDDLVNSGVVGQLKPAILDELLADIERDYDKSHTSYTLLKGLYDKIMDILGQVGDISDDSVNKLSDSLKKISEMDKDDIASAVRDLGSKNKGKLS